MAFNFDLKQPMNGSAPVPDEKKKPKKAKMSPSMQGLQQATMPMKPGAC